MMKHLPRALRIFGYLLILSMIVQLINYTIVFGYTPNLSYGDTILSRLIAIYGAISTSVLHGAIGLLCFFAAHSLSKEA